MLTKEQLWQLRRDIILNSLFTNDYRNRFNIAPRQVQDFFDGYLEELEYYMEDEIEGFNDSQFFDYLDEYDNIENLWEYYAYNDFVIDDPLRNLWKIEVGGVGISVIGSIIVESLYEPDEDEAAEFIIQKGLTQNPYDEDGYPMFDVEQIEPDYNIIPDFVIEQ